MKTPTSQWDRNPTDAELDRFYGKDKSHEVKDQMIETITESVRKVLIKSLSVPYVSHSNNMRIMPYPLFEVFQDYGSDKGPDAAWIEMIEKSDCPLVAAWRLAVAERYADMHADEVEEHKQ